MERKKLFGVRKTTDWGYFKPAYLSELFPEIFFKNQLKKVGDKVENSDDWYLEYTITNVEINCKQADDSYTFSELSQSLSAEHFLEYCKDHMVTSVIITQ